MNTNVAWPERWIDSWHAYEPSSQSSGRMRKWAACKRQAAFFIRPARTYSNWCKSPNRPDSGKGAGDTDEGYEYAVGIDLENFFDTVNQSYIIELLSHTVKGGRVIIHIHQYLYAGVMIDGMYHPTPEGTQQGGPLSLLLPTGPATLIDHCIGSFLRWAANLRPCFISPG